MPFISRFFFSIALFSASFFGRCGETSQTLRQAAGKIFIGTSTSFEGANGIIRGPHVEENRKYITKHFNCIQPAVYPTWGGFWPPQKPASAEDVSFWTEPLSTQAKWAKENGLYVLHHGLFSPNYYFPEWWREASYSADELEFILKKYVQAVVSVEHVDSWNLFNELLLGDGSYFPDGEGEWDNKWLGMGMEPDESGLTGEAKVNASHPKFIRMALEYARNLTGGKFELREGTTFENPRKLDALYQLALHLRHSGTPLHAVGIQGHLDYNGHYDFEAFKSTVEKFRKAGLEFYITELDVGLPKGENPETANWEVIEPLQAEMYYQILKAAREAGVSLICVWGLTDSTSGGWRGGERALLLNEDYSVKSSYGEAVRALSESSDPIP